MRNGTILRKKKTFLKKFYFYVKTLSELIVQQCRTYTVKTRSFSKWRRTFQRLHDVWTMAIKFSITLEYTFELPITVVQDILLLKIYIIKTYVWNNEWRTLDISFPIYVMRKLHCKLYLTTPGWLWSSDTRLYQKAYRWSYQLTELRK